MFQLSEGGAEANGEPGDGELGNVDAVEVFQFPYQDPLNWLVCNCFGKSIFDCKWQVELSITSVIVSSGWTGYRPVQLDSQENPKSRLYCGFESRKLV